MSTEALGAVSRMAGVRLLDGDGSSVAAWGLLMLLANYAHPDDGLCWYGQTTLAFRSGMSKSGVAKALNLLEAHGMISRRPRFLRNGSRTSDVIRVEVERLAAFAQTPPSLSEGGSPFEDLTDGFDSTKNPKRRTPPSLSKGGGVPHSVGEGPLLSEGETKGETKPLPFPPMADGETVDMAMVRSLAGEALGGVAMADDAAPPELARLVSGDPAKRCSLTLDLYPAVSTAAAYQLTHYGPGSLVGWRLVRKIALDNRDARLAGNPQPKAPSDDPDRDQRSDRAGRGQARPAGHAGTTRADANLDAIARVADRLARQAGR